MVAHLNNEEIVTVYVPDEMEMQTPSLKSTTRSTSQSILKNNNSIASTNKEIEAIELVKAYKEPAEANLIGAIYSNPDLLLDSRLSSEDFTYNHWRVYFIIAKDLYEERKTLSEDNIEFYLKQHTKLAEQYRLNKGYATIDRLVNIINTNDFDGYLAELGKWNAILKVALKGFPIKDMLSDFADKTAEDIYDKYTAYLNDAFINIEEKIKSYNIFDGLDTFNEECDKGTERGIDFCSLDPSATPILNNAVKGFNLNGHIYGLGATSGIGKTTFLINYLLPTIIDKKERAVFIINEEDERKFKREVETWVINNVILKPYNDKCEQEGKLEKQLHFNKERFSTGHFSTQEKEWLKKASEYLGSMKNEHLFTVIPLERYSVGLAIKIIKKYNKLFKVRMFCLDTFKESYDTYNNKDSTWKTMERDMRSLYDVVKSSALKVGLFVTYQLSKGSGKTRYLTSVDIGQAKNIEDVMSVNLMLRRLYPDEMYGGSAKLKVNSLNGMNEIVPGCDVDIKPCVNMVMFICKNRFGAANQFQIAIKANLGTNIIREDGITHVRQDF